MWATTGREVWKAYSEKPPFGIRLHIAFRGRFCAIKKGRLPSAFCRRE